MFRDCVTLSSHAAFFRLDFESFPCITVQSTNSQRNNSSNTAMSKDIYKYQEESACRSAETKAYMQVEYFDRCGSKIENWQLRLNSQISGYLPTKILDL